MPKTIKQIADELGVDKQKVYRYIKKNHINEAHREALQKNGVKEYDEAAEALIKQGFLREAASNESHHEVLQNHINDAVSDTVSNAVIEMLRKELEIKNKQIEDLNARLAEVSSALVMAQQTAASAQALHAGTIQQQLLSGEVEADQQPKPDSEEQVSRPIKSAWVKTEKKRGWFNRRRAL